MSIRKFLTIFAVSVFLIGTFAATKVLAEGWKQTLEEHETRITDLEQQVPGCCGIKVFDANNQFLGSYVSGGAWWLIFLPDLKAIIPIRIDNGDMQVTGMEFESTDCTGQGYSGSTNINRVPDGAGGFRYYTHINEGVNIFRRSYIHPETGACEPDTLGFPQIRFRAVEISEADIPALPVALPLRLE